MSRPSPGQALMWGGTALGGLFGVLGAVVPGGSLNWFFHAPSAVIGLPLSFALIASGAIVRRMEHAEPRAFTAEEVQRLIREADEITRENARG